MSTMRIAIARAALLLLVVILQPVAHAEVVEEIIAWVNGEIITKSEYDEEADVRIAELYRRLSGEELDAAVSQAREGLLLEIIDRKILVHQAQAIGYDLVVMGDAFLDQFKGQQNIRSDAELARLLEQEGMTVRDVKKRLIEMYAPEEVIRFEVTSRIAVSDREVDAFYDENQDQFFVEGEVTLREIVMLADTEALKDEKRSQADEIRRRIASGEKIEDLAPEHSQSGTSENGGLLGPLKKGDLAETLVGPAFTLPVGALSDVMETPYGFHIVRVESRMEDRNRPLDEIRDQVRAYLEDQKYNDELKAFLIRARSESEWCVKPKHQGLLSISAPPACETL